MDLRKKMNLSETLIQWFLFACGALSIFTTLGIVYELGKESLLFFTNYQWVDTNVKLMEDMTPDESTMLVSTQGRVFQTGNVFLLGNEMMRVTGMEEGQITVQRGIQSTEIESHLASTEILLGDQVTFEEFFGRTDWNPMVGQFGIWALVNATLMTSLIAMMVAIPLGLSVAIYLSEYASERFRKILKPVLEVLAGIPTVVYGYFALTFMTPLLRNIFGQNVVDIYNTAAAGIVIGILILPLVSSMSEDALSAVPKSLREASYGVGATKLETAIKVVVPAAFSGIAASFIIATSRAIGETMIVAIAAGAGPNFTFNPFKAAETMTGHIVRISGGDLSYNSIDYNSIFAIGLMLFIMTFSLNIISQRIVKRYREVYE